MPQRLLEPPTCGRQTILEAMLSAYRLPTLVVADEIGLFEHLDETPSSVAQIAHAYGIAQRAAEVMLGVLADGGHLLRHGECFHLTEASRQFLLPRSPYYQGAMLSMMGQMPITRDGIKEALFKSEAATNSAVFDTDMWQSSEENAAQLKAFTDMMHALFLPAAMGMAVHGDFGDVDNLLDVGGGSGCCCIALASRYPEMGLTVLDLPAVCPLVANYARPYGLADRIGTVVADMFRDEWPSGFDAHLFSNIFHDWDPEACRVLARKSFEALPAGGRIFLNEALLHESRDGPSMAPLYSMTMVYFTPGGKQYTASELGGFLTEAGFENVRITPTYTDYSLVSARKP